jgi:hypothetical protein
MTDSYLGAAAWAAGPVVFAGNDIDGDHAADRFRHGHTVVTGRQRAPDAKRSCAAPVLRNRSQMQQAGRCPPWRTSP